MSLIKDAKKNGDNKGIKSFFAPKAGKGDGAGNSPESTSDYESEPSRPESENGSHSNSPELKTEVRRRKVGDIKEEDEEGVDIFNTSKDDDEKKEEDEKLNAKAALNSGLISAEALNEEDRIQKEAARMEKQEKVKKDQLLEKEATEQISQSQRFERLKGLLGKSKFYTDFLLDKMQSHEAAMMLKEDKKTARAKKRKEESKSKNGASVTPEPEPKKRQEESKSKNR